MACRVGQIIARGDRKWLIRVYLGRDHETNKRNYHNRTIHGPMREAPAYLTRKPREPVDLTVGNVAFCNCGVLLQALCAECVRNFTVRCSDTSNMNYSFLQAEPNVGFGNPLFDSHRVLNGYAEVLDISAPASYVSRMVARMQFSEASSISSALSQPNGNRKPSRLSIGRTSSTANGPRLVSTKELSRMWDMPESTLRYWRCAGIGPPYVKLGGRIKYDLADVEDYVRANKRKPSVRAHGG